MKVSQSCLTLVTPWTIAYQAALSMEFSRLEYWSGYPIPSPADLPNPGIESESPALQVDSLPAELPGKESTCSAGVTEDMVSTPGSGRSLGGGDSNPFQYSLAWGIPGREEPGRSMGSQKSHIGQSD